MIKFFFIPSMLFYGITELTSKNTFLNFSFNKDLFRRKNV